MLVTLLAADFGIIFFSAAVVEAAVDPPFLFDERF